MENSDVDETKRGGLPEDDEALAAFARQAFKRSPSRLSGEAAPAGPVIQEQSPVEPPTQPPTAVPTPSVPVRIAGERHETATPEDVRGAAPVVSIPDLGAAGRIVTGCTVMVSPDVRSRFEDYQDQQKQTHGRAPTAVIVFRRAMLAAIRSGTLAELSRTAQRATQRTGAEDLDPEGLFGEVPTRRTEQGAIKGWVQQSMRPSRRELAVIDAHVDAYGFASRSDMLNAVLDAFLPPLGKAPRSKR